MGKFLYLFSYHKRFLYDGADSQSGTDTPSACVTSISPLTGQHNHTIHKNKAILGVIQEICNISVLLWIVYLKKKKHKCIVFQIFFAVYFKTRKQALHVRFLAITIEPWKVFKDFEGRLSLTYHFI